MDDRPDQDGDGIPDCVDFIPIPTTTTWGLVVLALLLLFCAPQDRVPALQCLSGAILIKLAAILAPIQPTQTGDQGSGHAISGPCITLPLLNVIAFGGRAGRIRQCRALSGYTGMRGRGYWKIAALGPPLEVP